MTATLYGRESRTPVMTGKHRVPGLYERTMMDGIKCYDVHARLGGKLRRHRLKATTKTDAILELRALQTDYARGEEHRSPSAGVTVGATLPRRGSRTFETG